MCLGTPIRPELERKNVIAETLSPLPDICVMCSVYFGMHYVAKTISKKCTSWTEQNVSAHNIPSGIAQIANMQTQL